MHMIETANNSVTAEPRGYNVTIRIDDDVVEPSKYRSEFYSLETATEQDAMSIRVNTYGGSAQTGIAFVNKILTCQAPTHGIIESDAQSCGSLIWLACDTHSWGVATKVMIHSGGAGFGGTPSNTIKSAESYKQQMLELFETTYKGFVTEEELTRIIEDDYQLDINADEIEERLQNMYSYRNGVVSSQHQEMEDLMWEENNRMIDEALTYLDGFSKKDKETFIKVRDALDSSMMEEDGLLPLKGSGSDNGTPLEADTYALSDVAGKQIGTIYAKWDEIFYDIAVRLDGKEYLIVDDEGGSVFDRKEYLCIARAIKGASQSKLKDDDLHVMVLNYILSSLSEELR